MMNGLDRTLRQWIEAHLEGVDIAAPETLRMLRYAAACERLARAADMDDAQPGHGSAYLAALAAWRALPCACQACKDIATAAALAEGTPAPSTAGRRGLLHYD